MRTIIFDIETVAFPVESLTDSQKEYIFRYAEKEIDPEIRKGKLLEAERCLSLYPYTSQIAAISIYDILKVKYLTYYNSPVEEEWQIEGTNVNYKGTNEENILTAFWNIAAHVDQAVTFNGKIFDIPYLMQRSAVLRIKPTKNFIAKRYDNLAHIDLLEQFTFFGLTKKFNLDFYCHAFGIESSKTNEINGMEVKNMFEAGQFKEIAMYCREDVRATFELYKIWDEYLNKI